MMFWPTTRRGFLRTAATGGALAGLADLRFLSQLPPVAAAEAQVDPGQVRFSSEIEPTVRLLEETPRERLLEEVAGRIRGGLPYDELLAALLLAGVRNVQPRPSVGFKFHAVLVVNSAHLASLSSPDEYRWLPIFWALDYFKEAQAQDVREGNWTMVPVDEARVPSPPQARQALIDALDSWDEAAVDVATAGLARSAKPADIYELLFRYGARDFRDIGHKAIFVANSRRTLERLGWHHAEPVLRSLSYALVHHEGDNPARRDAPADRPWRENLERAKSIREGWQSGRTDEGATRELLATLRNDSERAACQQVVEMLNREVAPQAIWDAFFLGAAELLVRQRGIVALHAVTSTNALRYAYETTTADDTRRMLLLQNAAFLPLFREAMRGRGSMQDWQIEQLEPLAPQAPAGEALAGIFAQLDHDRMGAARQAAGYLSAHPEPGDFINAARVLIYLKGNNAHDYKFSSALLEDYAHLSPEHRARYLAAGVFELRGAGEPDNQLVARTRAALAG